MKFDQLGLSKKVLDAVTATGFETATPIQAGAIPPTLERKDVGIKLKIKPQISDGETIQLEVMQEISSVSTIASVGCPESGMPS